MQKNEYYANPYKTPQSKTRLQQNYEVTLDLWSVPVERLRVNTRFGETHVLRAGTVGKPVLVMFHGWGAHAATLFYEYDFAALTPHFQLYMPDTIGQSGYSAPSRPPTVGAFYGEWIKDVFNGLQIDQVYCVGASEGAFLALKAASYLPDRVRAVLAISPVGILSSLVVSVTFLFRMFAIMRMPTEEKYFRLMNEIKSPNAEWNLGHKTSIAMMTLLNEEYRYDKGVKAISDKELRRIRTPIEMLLGEDDILLLKAKVIQRAQRMISHLTLEVVPNAGHVLTYDRPGLAEARMLKWTGLST